MDVLISHIPDNSSESDGTASWILCYASTREHNWGILINSLDTSFNLGILINSLDISFNIPFPHPWTLQTLLCR